MNWDELWKKEENEVADGENKFARTFTDRKPTKGYKTRKNKRTQRFIVRSRHKR